MKLLLLVPFIFYFSLVMSCGKKAPHKEEAAFISFQAGTENFYLHYSDGAAVVISREDYLKKRNELKIYRRGGNNFLTAAEFEKEIEENPDLVFLCYDHGTGERIDLECHQGRWL